MDEEQSGQEEYSEDDPFVDNGPHSEQSAHSPFTGPVDVGLPSALPLATAFLIGLLFGWIALGWWLFPVEWTDALPVDLRADARGEYVQMVADLHVRENDVERSRLRLRSFVGAEGDLRSVAAIIAAIRSAGDTDPIESQNVERLASDLRIVPRAAEGESAIDPGSIAESGSDGVGDGISGAASADASGTWLRSLAIGVLIAGAGAGAALAWAWATWRGAPRGSQRQQGARESRHKDGRRTNLEEDGALAGISGAMADPDPGPKTRSGRGSIPDRQPGLKRGQIDVLSFAAAERRGVTGAWSSSPTRIALGETKTIEYEATDEPFRWSWLVHDEHDHVAATVEIKERRIGAVNALELTFFEKLAGDGGDHHSKVSIVARSAADNSLLANDLLKDRVVAPAIQGDVVTLTTSDFVVDIEIRSVAPDPSISDVMDFRSLTLAISPTRRSFEVSDDQGAVK